MQLELLDTRTWKTRKELANAMFEWIECWRTTPPRPKDVELHRAALPENA